jgi:hypothetical protein
MTIDVGVSATGVAMTLTVLGAATIVRQIVLGGIGDKIGDPLPGYTKCYKSGRMGQGKIKISGGLSV